ncbi:hypothetical protein BDZ97DRAFT_1870813 [Flammula alnicola]|nr:hypothetical protein BDZ97DRAFT_1870813 [Flammula alnicola]
MSRSPSPIRYARPDSRGNLSDDTNDGDDGGGGGGDVESSEEDGEGEERRGMELTTRRRRTQQLRSYRNSYRPHDGRTSPPHIPYRRSPSPVQEQHQHQHQQGIQSTEQEKLEKEKEKEKEKEQKDKKREKKEKKAKKEPRKATRSYFGEYSRSSGGGGLSAAAAGPLSLSVPGTRASSPERKSRSRQPRKLGLADAVSLALDEVRNIGTGRGTSTSPRRRLKSLVGPPMPSAVAAPVRVLQEEEEEGEVLDISRPISARRDTRDTVGTMDTSSSSARSSMKLGWVKAMAKKRAEAAAGEASGSSASGSVAHLSGGAGATAALGEMDSAETPYMTSKPPAAPLASFVPPLPHHQHHRRVDSLGQEDRPLLLPSSARTRVDSGEGEGERYSIACGLPIGSRTRNPEPPAVIASTVSASTRAASSSSSIATSNPPFSSAFGIISRSGGTKSKKKHTPSASLADGPRAEPTLVIERDLLPMHDGGDGDAGRAWQGEEQTTAGDRDKERGDVVGLTTRRVTRTVDPDGDVWEHEQETGVLDVIPHLRNLRVRKS